MAPEEPRQTLMRSEEYKCDLYVEYFVTSNRIKAHWGQLLKIKRDQNKGDKEELGIEATGRETECTSDAYEHLAGNADLR